MAKCIQCGKETDETGSFSDIDTFPYPTNCQQLPQCKSCKAKDDRNVTLGCLVIVVVILFLTITTIIYLTIK